MEEAMAAIRRAITDEEAGEMTLAPAEPRAFGEKTGAKPEAGLLSPKANCRDRLRIQHVDGNCEEA
jgi:hypothetical protein